MRVAFLLRILASVALIVSGLPVWALVCRPATPLPPAYAAPASSAASPCGMPCCAGKAMGAGSDSCCAKAQDGKGLASASHLESGCSLAPIGVGGVDVVTTSADLAPPVLAGEILPLPAVPAPVRVLEAEQLARLRVGIEGLDAGPPSASTCLPSAGRSPPSPRV